MWTTPRNRPVGVSSGGRAMKIEEASAGESSSRRTWARASATVASGGRMTGTGRHQAAGGVLVVFEQAAHVLGAFGFHQLQQFLGLRAGEFGEEVGGVVGVHLLQHVGGAFDVEGGEDFHLVALGHFLQDVGEAFVLEFAGDLEAALVAHLLQGLGEVGGLEVLVRGDELGGGLGLGAGALLGVGPVDDHGLVAAQPAQRREGVAAADEELADEPVAGAVPVHRDVLDGGVAAAVGEGHAAVEHLGRPRGFPRRAVRSGAG